MDNKLLDEYNRIWTLRNEHLVRMEAEMDAIEMAIEEHKAKIEELTQRFEQVDGQRHDLCGRISQAMLSIERAAGTSFCFSEEADLYVYPTPEGKKLPHIESDPFGIRLALEGC